VLATNDALGGDPYVGFTKCLEIDYYCGESGEIAGYYLIEHNSSNGELVTDINNCNASNLCDLYKCNNERKCEFKNITGYVLFNSDGILLKCENGNCLKVNSPKTGYYLNSGDDKNNNPLIYCSENEDVCSSETASDNEGYYLHGGADVIKKALIHCNNKISCDEPIDISFGENEAFKYFINNGSDNKTNKLIECLSSGCSSKEASNKDGYYLHGGTTGANLSDALIKCDSECKIDNTITVENLTYRYYLNNGSDSTNKKLIECSSNSNSCSTVTASTGYYLNSGNNLIKCNGENSCDSPSKIIISDGSFKYFINNGSDKDNTAKKLLIECSSGGCSSKEASNNDGYYLHGGTTGANLSDALIKCDSECKIDNTITVENLTYRYYLNNGSDSTNKKLIECSSNSNSCSTVTASTGYYLNSGNNLIKCNGENSCDSPSKIIISDGSFKYFINNGSDKDNTAKKLLIECSSGGCSSKEASNNDGYYIHGGTMGFSSTDALIICDSSKCNIDNTVTVEDSTYRYYLNNGKDNINKKLIECSSDSCSTVSASTGYYLNSGNNLIKCNGENSCESPSEINFNNGLFSYFINNGKDKDNKKLIECSKSENNCLTKIVASTGYYINSDNTAIACIKDQECEEVTYDNYMINNCEDKYLGKIVNQSENIFLCSSVDIDKSKPGLYISSVNSDSFPGSLKGLILLEYNNVKNTILKVEGNDECTEDRQIIFKNNKYYYCVNVIIHETYENGEENPNKELTRYESVSISMNSIGSSFVMNFGKDGEYDYKVVNIEENGKITMNYGKYTKVNDIYNRNSLKITISIINYYLFIIYFFL